MVADLKRKGKRLCVCAFELLEQDTKGLEMMDRRRSRLFPLRIALMAGERAFRSYETRRVATKEVVNACAVVATDKLARALARRAEVVAVGRWRILKIS